MRYSRRGFKHQPMHIHGIGTPPSFGKGAFILSLQGIHVDRIRDNQRHRGRAYQNSRSCRWSPCWSRPKSRASAIQLQSSSTLRRAILNHRFHLTNPVTKFSRPCSKSSATNGATSGCSLSLGARGRSAFMRRPHRALDEPNRRRRAIRQRHKDGSRADGAARVLRRFDPQTAPQIEESFRDTVAILDPHFATRDYLFGNRPAFADFGLWGQLYNAWTDPPPARSSMRRRPICSPGSIG